jgi:hypothetical protein
MRKVKWISERGIGIEEPKTIIKQLSHFDKILKFLKKYIK